MQLPLALALGAVLLCLAAPLAAADVDVYTCAGPQCTNRAHVAVTWTDCDVFVPTTVGPLPATDCP